MNAFYSILFCFFLGSIVPLQAAGSLFDYWNAHNITEVKLYLDLQEVESLRKSSESFTATLFDGQREYKIRGEVRGRFRRRNCSMPPLKLHFDKAGLRQMGLNKHNDYKLVTHCTDDAGGQDAILREKLAYELYQTIAPEASFRTRLLRVTYVDIRTQATTTSLAILIEDNDELKGRMNGKFCKDCFSLPAQQISNAAQVALFQYMIGNTDYSFVMGRNMKLVENYPGNYTAVPYDFDFSGLVDASYATPNVNIGQQSIKERVWHWEYTTNPDLSSAKQQFLAKQNQLLAQVENFPNLSSRSRKEISKYLQGFFRDLQGNKIMSQTAR